MIERDYILRMINLLVQAMAKVLFHKKAYEFPQARREIDGAYKSLVGMARDFLRQFSDVQLIGMLGQDHETVVAKCYVLGSLMKEDAEMYSLENNAVECQSLYQRSLSLLLTSYLGAGNGIEPVHGERIDALLALTKDSDIPPHILEKIVLYNELTGKYDKAEDVLFGLIDQDGSYMKAGVEFYERLLKKSDAELVRGNLPRSELVEGLTSIKKD